MIKSSLSKFISTNFSLPPPTSSTTSTATTTTTATFQSLSTTINSTTTATTQRSDFDDNFPAAKYTCPFGEEKHSAVSLRVQGPILKSSFYCNKWHNNWNILQEFVAWFEAFNEFAPNLRDHVLLFNHFCNILSLAVFWYCIWQNIQPTVATNYAIGQVFIGINGKILSK